MPPSTTIRIPPNHPRGAEFQAHARALSARAALTPHDPALWAELAALAVEVQDATGAIQCSAEALRLNRKDAGIYYLAGRAARLVGDVPLAIEHYRKATRLQPKMVEAWVSLANAQRAHAAYDHALAALQKAHELAPDRADIWINLGNVFVDCSDYHNAASSFEHALQLSPDHAAAQLGLAHAWVIMGGFAESMPLLEAVIAAGHSLASAHYLLGRCHYLLGKTALAREHFQRAWTHALDDPAAHAHAYDKLLAECEDPEAGLPLIQARRREHADDLLLFQCELDVLIYALRTDEAIALLKEPQCARLAAEDLGLSRVQLAMRLKDPDEALQIAQTVISEPSFAESPNVRFTTGVLLLRSGDYVRGLPWYESRLEFDGVPGMQNKLQRLGRLWRGEDLHGKRVLVWQEQGMGDVLQMTRFVRDLRAAGAVDVQFVADPPLLPLLAAQPDIRAVWAKTTQAESYDFHIPDMSLMARFLKDLNALAEHPPNLVAPPASVAAWGERLGARDGRLRVAIAWAGNPNLDMDRYRSVPVSALAPLATLQGVQWFNVQKGSPAAQFSGEPPFAYTDVRADLNNFADSAGLFAHMDLIISVDSAPVHLAASLGRPTWLLNRSTSEYRWMLGREDSPWYPSLRLFNQRQAAEWDETLLRVAEALGERLALSPRTPGVHACHPA